MPKQKHPAVAQIERVFTYHQPASKDHAASLEKMRKQFGALAKKVHQAMPDGREKALALTKLEEASMFAIAGMVRPNDAPAEPAAVPVKKATKRAAKSAGIESAKKAVKRQRRVVAD